MGHFKLRCVNNLFCPTNITEDFMKTAKEVLEQYKHADMGRRLNIYLQYRDYREEFLLIDRGDNDTRKVETLGNRTKFSSLRGPSSNRNRPIQRSSFLPYCQPCEMFRFVRD